MKILVIASDKGGRFAPFIEEQIAALQARGVQIIRYGVTGHGIMGYLRELPALRRLIRAERPDIVHAHYGLSGLLANLQRLVPVVTTYHGSDINKPNIRRFSKIAMRLSAHNIFVSARSAYLAMGNGQWAIDKTVLDNDSVLKVWKESGLPSKEFFELKTERGDVLNAWMIKPVGFDAAKKYPVVMMQYSGPASQRVTDTWRKRFGHYLASQGYVVVCVDGRGTNARGRDWRNATYMQLGVKEAEDQISAAKYLKTLPYVDGDRMAICGWSYGGYETLMCLSKQAELVWKCGIAIAPVTSWRLYDSAYTERYMRRPQVNEFGYEKADVMQLANDLKGNLLLVHGLADDNVHAQQSWLYVDALVQAGKQFEMQMYVDDNHFLRNGNNYEHLHKRIMLFLEKNL